MLINTVILLLRDALPIAILLGLMLALFPLERKPLGWVIGGSLAGTLLLVFTRNTVSQWVDGTGYELLSVLLYAVTFAAMLRLLYQQTVNSRAQLVMAVSLISLHLADFAVYVVAFSTRDATTTSLLVGSILGIGICASVSVLLYIFLTPHRAIRGLQVLLVVFVAGHVAESTQLLQQVDFMQESSAMWDSRQFVSDESEYGHLLNALFGYQARPDREYVLCWFLLVISAVVVLVAGNRRHHTGLFSGESVNG